MSSDDVSRSLANESNDDLLETPNASSATGSKIIPQVDLDHNKSTPTGPVKSPVKKHVPVGRRLEDIDPNLSGSVDLSGDSKAKISHHRVDDLSAIEENYVIGKKLGQGAFGTVRVIESKLNGESFACKCIKKRVGSTSLYEQLQKELVIMKKVRHPNIVQLYEVYETPKKIYMIMEYCRGGELVQKIRNRRYCTEEETRIIIRKLTDVVGYLHDHGVVHRDIKPENILLATIDEDDKFDIKLSDFGLATFSDTCTMMENMAGTPMYMAPEIVKNLGYSGQCDIWSMGVMMYLLLCGYRKDVEFKLHNNISDGVIEFPEELFKDISPAAINLCEHMLKFDPAKRLTAREIEGHPWITGDAKASHIKPNVLDLMRSYNAEHRLRKIFITVLAAMRFRSVLFQGERRRSPESSVFISVLSLEDSSTASNSSLTKLSGGKGSILQKKQESVGPIAAERSKISIRRESKPKIFDDQQFSRQKSFKDSQLTSAINRKSIDKIPEKLETKAKSQRPARASKDLSVSKSPQIPKLGIPSLPQASNSISPASSTLSATKATSNRPKNLSRKSVDFGSRIGDLK